MKKTLLNCQRLSEKSFLNTPKHPISLVLDNIRSGYNVGATFRLSDAFLLEHIYLGGITPTPPHLQIQKTALGAEKIVSWTHVANLEILVQHLKQQGYYIIAVELADGSIPLHKVNFNTIAKPCVLIFGHELLGIQQNILDIADICIEIPQYGTKLSMNVATCMSIVIWEFIKSTL